MAYDKELSDRLSKKFSIALKMLSQMDRVFVANSDPEDVELGVIMAALILSRAELGAAIFDSHPNYPAAKAISEAILSVSYESTMEQLEGKSLEELLVMVKERKKGMTEPPEDTSDPRLN